MVRFNATGITITPTRFDPHLYPPDVLKTDGRSSLFRRLRLGMLPAGSRPDWRRFRQHRVGHAWRPGDDRNQRGIAQDGSPPAPGGRTLRPDVAPGPMIFSHRCGLIEQRHNRLAMQRP